MTSPAAAVTRSDPAPRNGVEKEHQQEEEEEEDGDDEVGEDDEEDSFFESFDRIPSSVSFDLRIASSSSDPDDDDDDDDPRISFASAVAPPSEFRRLFSSNSIADLSTIVDEDGADDEEGDYSIWMAEPMSIEERRSRLLKGMGLSRSTRSGFSGSPRTQGRAPLPKPPSSSNLAPKPSDPNSPLAASPSALPRCRSDTGAVAPEAARRRQELLGTPPPATSLARASTLPYLRRSSNDRSARSNGLRRKTMSRRVRREDRGDFAKQGRLNSTASLQRLGAESHQDRADEAVALYTIKNLDTGKEFVINLENGSWNSRLSDMQTGTQLTMDEFERSVGHSPIVRELMRREFATPVSNANGEAARAASMKSASKKKGVNWLKNIRGVANSVTGLVLEREGSLADRLSGRIASSSSSASSDWMKVHRRGKPYKELTGLYMSQEIHAHEGSIWCMKFSPDALYMASAGEDRVIHVWQVLDCDSVSSSQRPLCDPSVSPVSPKTNDSQDQSARLNINPSAKLKRGKTLSSRKKNALPEYVVVPETVFSFSDMPFCSFQGHLDDVLDLSWSKSQYLLSSSMDKTVRLWDMESKACLKLFAHNDYVTCIQFNPVDDRYFISGSLDAKVRIWSIPDRQVVDWNDLHEMVTAACYTPDGQGALVGSHKGSCRFYSMSDSKLHQKAQIDIHNKKKKSHAKKITGFQFSPGNPSEVLVTSADSQIRVFDGIDPIHKFRGFRNTSSQISASFTPDGNYVICASEDSHVYIWKREETRHATTASKGKTWVTTRSHENFHCKDVSVAIPWPGSNRYEPPSLPSSRFKEPPPSVYQDCQPPLSASIACSPDDPFSSCRSHCPLPPKKDSPEIALNSAEEDLRNPSRVESGISVSSTISTSWLRSGPLSSIYGFGMSASSASSSRWHNGGNSRGSVVPAATAWGLVIVTAGLDGEIRVYQNFGLPLRLSRQTNLFGVV